MRWTVVAGSLLLAAFVGGCGMVVGSGQVVSETREVGNFRRVSLDGSGELTIVQGETTSLTVEAEDNLMERIRTEVRGGTLHLGLEGRFWPTIFRTTRPIRFHLTVRSPLEGVAVSGSGDATAEELVAERIELAISGSGNIVIGTLTAEGVEVSISGSGTVEAAGQVADQDVNISGSGNYRAADLVSATAELTISGSGEATVWVMESLNVEVSGSGNVSYYGQPRVSQQASGSGRIQSLGDH